MKKPNKTLYLTLICTFFWCVLHKSFHWDKILTGFLLALFVVFFYQRFLSLPHAPVYPFPFLAMLRYPFALFSQALKSGVQTAQVVLKKEAAPVLVKVPSRLKSEWSRTLVANSITLTPGRVAVDIMEDYYIVLCVKSFGQTPEDYYQQIVEPFEKLLQKGETDA